MTIDTYRINAPEVIGVSYPIAGIGSRFLATALDFLIVLAALIAILVGTIALAASNRVAADAAVILGSTLIFLLIFGYYVAFETLWSGRTPGKRLIHLRVLKTTGYPIGFVDAAIRNVVRIADFLPGFYGIGVVVMFISPQSRRLGDYAAGTIVVKEQGPVALKDLVAAPSVLTIQRGAIDPEELRWDLRALSTEELRLTTELLARLPQLSPSAARDLTERFAERIGEKIGARPAANAAEFLRRVVELREAGEG